MGDSKGSWDTQPWSACGVHVGQDQHRSPGFPAPRARPFPGAEPPCGTWSSSLCPPRSPGPGALALPRRPACRSPPGNAVTGQLACAAGEVPPRERSEMRARLYLNLGLVYDSLKDQGQCSQYIRKSIFISE